MLDVYSARLRFEFTLSILLPFGNTNRFVVTMKIFMVRKLRRSYINCVYETRSVRNCPHFFCRRFKFLLLLDCCRLFCMLIGRLLPMLWFYNGFVFTWHNTTGCLHLRSLHTLAVDICNGNKCVIYWGTISYYNFWRLIISYSSYFNIKFGIIFSKYLQDA